MFDNRSQIDVVSVLLLLGEATIWKAVWSRFRFRRSPWKQWLFAVAPGWAPFAGTVFAAVNGSKGPPNMIFDRPPEGIIDTNLILTNLNSGASHSANHVILQDVWQTWDRGPRAQRQSPPIKEESYDVSRAVGVVDVDFTAMQLQSGWAVWLQCGCLVA